MAGKRKIEFTEVPDPRIEEPGDVKVKVIASAICRSNVHLYELLGPYRHAGDVVGHEAMGVVEEIGRRFPR